MIGAHYLARDTLVTPGAFLGAALWAAGPEVNFLFAAVVGVSGTLFYGATARKR
jgi:hypothetical protein